MGTPWRVAATRTSRQSSWAAAISWANVASDSRLGRSGRVSYAARIRSRKAARMMQPPRQIEATEPRSMFQSYSSLPAVISWNPCVYETIFDAYRACSTRSAKAAASDSSSR